jgi:Ca2+-transporting ATPase
MPGQEILDFSEIEKDMDFAGLIGFEDPPRKGVRETISIAARAGVRTIMVTGDHPLTAGFIAKEVGIPAERVAMGRDLDNLSDIDLRETLKRTSVFARTNPWHKYRIVKALQENGDVVAVTGDGINDVLALKGADIGIAMGIKGTDVAKEAAEVVLGDDNYVTITQGIFEGRKFFDNLQKGIIYYLSVKFGLILTFLLPVLLGVPAPFSPIQIIILELFMDLAASAGFVAEPEENNMRSRPPRNPREGVITNRLIGKILFNGMLLFCAVISVYFYAGYQNMSLGQTQTFAFSAWIFGHIFLAFLSRTDKESLTHIGIFSNKIIDLWALASIAFLVMGTHISFLRERFHFASIDMTSLLAIAFFSMVVISPAVVKKKRRLS